MASVFSIKLDAEVHNWHDGRVAQNCAHQTGGIMALPEGLSLHRVGSWRDRETCQHLYLSLIAGQLPVHFMNNFRQIVFRSFQSPHSHVYAVREAENGEIVATCVIERFSSLLDREPTLRRDDVSALRTHFGVQRFSSTYFLTCQAVAPKYKDRGLSYLLMKSVFEIMRGALVVAHLPRMQTPAKQEGKTSLEELVDRGLVREVSLNQRYYYMSEKGISDIEKVWVELGEWPVVV
ncbi:MAG: hypothetical protein NT003_01960 [Candidatus Magasanikbacteria bacterium]|nr:hypothetical protein [Candidatus Magasanikbacteria bacterium]